MNFLTYCYKLSTNNTLLLFTFLAFLVKFPIFFFHQWLPKAHVEAPVGGSMILAGLLLAGIFMFLIAMGAIRFFVYVLMCVFLFLFLCFGR